MSNYFSKFSRLDMSNINRKINPTSFHQKRNKTGPIYPGVLARKGVNVHVTGSGTKFDRRSTDGCSIRMLHHWMCRDLFQFRNQIVFLWVSCHIKWHSMLHRFWVSMSFWFLWLCLRAFNVFVLRPLTWGLLINSPLEREILQAQEYYRQISKPFLPCFIATRSLQWHKFASYDKKALI